MIRKLIVSKSLQKKVTAQASAPFQGDGYTAYIQQYSNKGPLMVVQLQGGGERRCLLDLLTGNWKPLD